MVLKYKYEKYINCSFLLSRKKWRPSRYDRESSTLAGRRPDYAINCKAIGGPTKGARIKRISDINLIIIS